MQVTEHVHAIRIPFQVKAGSGVIERFVYAYLIYGKKVYLIDSGVASSELVLFDYMKKTGRSPAEISMLIQTHSHPDHIGATQAVKRVSGCTVAAHSGEKSWIEDVELQLRERPVPNFHSLVGGSVKIDRILEDGDILELDDDLRLEVFHTPGHSKGSISLLLHGDGALFSGDVIPLVGDIPIYDDVLTSIRSIKKLRGIKGVNFLLASWDDPRKGDDVYRIMDEGLSYLQHIHDVVLKIVDDNPSLELEEICKQVQEELGLLGPVNPLMARSVGANLKIRDQRHLL